MTARALERGTPEAWFWGYVFFLLVSSVALPLVVACALDLRHNAERFWQLEPGAVTQIEVYRLPESPLRQEDLTPAKRVLVLTDRNAIQSGLDILARSAPLPRSHESFVDGYLLHLVAASSTKPQDVYIAVAKRSTRDGRRVYAVEPRADLSDQSLGVYQNPEFHHWLESLLEH